MNRAKRELQALQREKAEIANELCAERGTNVATWGSKLPPGRYRQLQARLEHIAEYHGMVEDNIVNHIFYEQYESLLHQTLLQQMHAKLPRELRDIVYFYILGEQQVAVTKTSSAIISIGNPGILDAAMSALFCDRLASRDYRHLIKAGAIPQAAKLELVESWCALSTFRFASLDDLGNFLTHHGRGWGLDPRVHVKKVEFYNYVSSKDDVTDSLNEVKRSFGWFHTMKPRAEITLSLHFADSHCGAGADRTAVVPVAILLRELQAEILRLLYKGYKVNMKFGYVLKFAVQADELTEECWNEKIRAHQEVSRGQKACAVETL